MASRDPRFDSKRTGHYDMASRANREISGLLDGAQTFAKRAECGVAIIARKLGSDVDRLDRDAP